MLRRLLLWTAVLATVGANDCPYLCALSPTPRLLHVERGENFTTRVARKDSGAFVLVEHGPNVEGPFGMSIITAWPSHSIKLMPWNACDSLLDSGWILALMPDASTITDFSSPDDWLQETGFVGQDEEYFGSWLERRKEDEPFAAVILSCATRSEDSGNVAYTCAGRRE